MTESTLARAKPILLTRAEVRALLQRGQAEIRRAMRPGPVALQQTWSVGDCLWGREAFSCRLDGDKIKLRYPADGPQGEPSFVPLDQGNRRFATEGYRTWPAKHMPRWASRLLLKIVAVHTEGHGQQEAVLTLRRTEG